MANTVLDKFFLKGAYVDESMLNLNNFQELNAVSSSKYFEGMTANINNNGKPIELQLVGGKKKSNWKIRFTQQYQTYEELLADVDSIIEALGVTNPSHMFAKGTEVVIQDGGDGKPAKYWIVGVDNNKPVWEKKEYGGSNVTTSGEDIENF